MLSIRTQDRMALVPYDSNIEIRPQSDPDNKWRIDLNKDCDSRTLGSYATKERALKVLDEIENCIKHNGEVSITGNDRLITIYQMPTE